MLSPPFDSNSAPRMQPNRSASSVFRSWTPHFLIFGSSLFPREKWEAKEAEAVGVNSFPLAWNLPSSALRYLPSIPFASNCPLLDVRMSPKVWFTNTDMYLEFNTTTIYRRHLKSIRTLRAFAIQHFTAQKSICFPLIAAVLEIIPILFDPRYWTRNHLQGSAAPRIENW